MMTEEQARAAVVAEARTWIGTPYHHQGDVKGAGVDCGMLLIEVYSSLGLIPKIDPRPYPHDWHLHRSAERYLGWVKEFAKEVTDREPMAGDVILYKFGRCLSHGAIVTEYPFVVHSYLGKGVLESDTTQNPLGSRMAGVYDIWGVR